MVPTVEHTLMTVHGILPGGESWSCGLRTYHRASFLSPATGLTFSAAVANRWRVFGNANATLFGSTGSVQLATVDGVTVREIDINGLTVTQYEGIPTTAATFGSSTDSPRPNQCSIVATLLTDRAGRTGKGRIYLPFLGASALAGGRLAGSFTNGLATSVAGLINNINTDLATAYATALKVAVQSPKSAKAVFDDDSLADYNGAVVTGVRIGDVIDTQRRRRKGLRENYSQVAVA